MKVKIKRFLFGFELFDGFIFKLIIYTLLICMGFVFMRPVLDMLSASFKSLMDLIDPTVGFIPSEIYLGNYERASEVLRLSTNLSKSLYVTIIPAVLQTVAAAIIGYGFAKFKFPLKNVWFALSLATFIIPPQITSIPKFLTFKSLGILDSIMAFALPAITGQGLKSAIFILIYYQFFRMIPKSLDEAAQLDGAGQIKIFTKIAIPMVIPAIITSFIFSFVWYWNETYTTSLYLQSSQLTTLPLELQNFTATFTSMYPSAGETMMRLNEGIRMSGTIITIAPLLIMYFLLQRWFVESVDKSGITGE